MGSKSENIASGTHLYCAEHLQQKAVLSLVSGFSEQGRDVVAVAPHDFLESTTLPCGTVAAALDKMA